MAKSDSSGATDSADAPMLEQIGQAIAADPTAREAFAAWLDGYIRNSAYARDTETWNRIMSGAGTINTAIDRFDAIQKGQ
jgi:hypothetical protein